MKPLLFVFALFFSANLIGQTATPPDSTVNWGSEFPLAPGLEKNYKLVSTAPNGYQLWLYPQRAPAALLNFNHKHRLRQTRTYRAFYDRPNLRFQGFSFGLNDTLAFFEERDRRAEQQQVFVSSYKNGELGPLRPLISFDLSHNWSAVSIRSAQNYRLQDISPLCQSPNKALFAYVETLSPGVTNTHPRYIVTVINEAGDILWSKEVDRTDAAEYITALDVAVTDQGEVLILAQLHASRNYAMARGLPHIAGYRMQIFHCTADTVIDIDIHPRQDIIPMASRLHLPPRQGDQVMVVGMYQDNSTNHVTDGFYIKRINLAEARYTADYYPYSRFAMNQGELVDKHWQNRMVLRDYFQFADGSFGLVAELAFPRSGPGPGGNTSYFTHQLLIPMFSPNGELLRLASLDKYLISSDLAESSYGLGVVNDQLHIVYNERGQSLRRKFPDVDMRNKSFGTVLSTLDVNGTWAAHRLLAARNDINFDPLPRRAIFTDSFCFLPAENHKNVSIGTIALE